jgi:hypothetical protein
MTATKSQNPNLDKEQATHHVSNGRRSTTENDKTP